MQPVKTIRQQVVTLLSDHYRTALEMRQAIGCTHEQIYQELVSLEAIGAVKVTPRHRAYGTFWRLQ